MHAQLVWKPGTVKICYHGLSAHKEQFTITTDGKNGHCPIAWTEGQPDDAQTSHRKKPFCADFPYFLLFARWGETMVSLKAYLRCKQSNHLATGRAHRDWRPHRLNAQVYFEQGWSPSKVKTGQYLPGREINEYRGVVDNLYKFNDLSTKFSSIKECKLCRLFAVAIFNVTSSNEKAPSETAAGQFGANGLQVG